MPDLRQVQVYCWFPDGDRLVGEAQFTGHARTLRTRFSYAPEWLCDDDSFDLSPDCGRSAGELVFADLPGFMRDGAPDSWGQHVILRSRRAASAGSSLDDAGFLLAASDRDRSGALRYSLDGGASFVAEGEPSGQPQLEELLDAAASIELNSASAEQCALLLGAGGSSAGGARPKATVSDGEGARWIAKFPSSADRWDVMGLEHAASLLQEACSIDVPQTKIVDLQGRKCFLSKRFDREGASRVPMMSATTALASAAPDGCDYCDFADALRSMSALPQEDLEQLYRRLVFNIAVNDVDDHMNNFALLRAGRGWRLSPSFDVNPCLDPLATVHESSAHMLFSRQERVLESVAEDFGIERGRAASAVREVVGVLSDGARDACSQASVEASDAQRLVEMLTPQLEALRAAIG